MGVQEWVDEHRELILLTAVLPAGRVLTAYEDWKRRREAPDPAAHHARVDRVCHQVRQRPAGSPVRTDRRGAVALNTRVSDKSGSTKVQMHDLRAILRVDRDRGIIRVEPSVTIGEVAEHLDAMGLQLEATIEMKGATMGGLVLAIGMTTHSHHCGLVHDTVEAYELVTADGELVRATREGQHADLFRAIPWSHGTLGLLVALELRVVPAPKLVRLVYRPFHDMEAYCAAHQAALEGEDAPWFVEGQIFGRDAAVLIEGHLDGDEHPELPVRDVARWDQPFFFKRVEETLTTGQTQERVPTYSFHMRHERSMCMTMGQILPTANEPWFRRTMGWTMPPNMALLKGSRPPEERARAMRRQVYQDFAFPAESLVEMLDHVDRTFGIYPLLVYPCRVIDRGGMVRLPGHHGTEWDGQERSALYLNFGIYGTPRAIREGDLQFPTVTRVRQVEALVRERGGFLHTYVDVFSTEAEFEAMFDHGLWRRMRKQYGADGAFPSIYRKIKPELDPLGFLDEEATWIAAK